VLFGEHVTDTAGTGLVHTAPGHGPEDFAVGQAHGLASACPVDEQGRFTRDTDEAVPFVGLHVLKEGNAKVLEALTARGALVHVERYLHRYPYDWLNYDYDYLHMSMIGYDYDYERHAGIRMIGAPKHRSSSARRLSGSSTSGGCVRAR
jgi:hypothetical protein